mmetsp:Transcript_3037/g.6561  ORF Transcript_3037/g.6561 Transcript_3037/m.6561 type:complete len:81 (+) Transcript_3037:373-615(+)
MDGWELRSVTLMKKRVIVMRQERRRDGLVFSLRGLLVMGALSDLIPWQNRSTRDRQQTRSVSTTYCNKLDTCAKLMEVIL